jgi:peptide deformylase
MAILPIVTYPNPILEKKAQKIADIESSEIKELILDMLETMDNHQEAVGLAAPQVGKSVSLCIIKLEGKTHILINPKIKSKSWKKEIREEGCLSFPGKFIPVKRSARVKVEAEDRKGKKIILKGEGLLGRAFQHEIDHLNGILYIEKEIK